MEGTRGRIEEFAGKTLPTGVRFLEHFLNGNGEAMMLDADQALAFRQVQEMDATVQGYFGGKLMEPGNRAASQILDMADGETMVLTDQWESATRPTKGELWNLDDDFVVSFGSATVTGTSYWKVHRDGDLITFEGPVLFDLFDVYNFNEEGGLFGPIINYKTADQRFLQREGEGRPFRSGSSWTRHVTGTARIVDGKLVDVQLNWGDAQVQPDGATNME